MTYTVLVPNRYSDIIAPLIESLNKYEPDANILILADQHSNGYGFPVFSHGLEKFQFSIVMNIGIEMRPHDDIILLNDDCVLLEPTFTKLFEIADRYPSVGILSPLIRGCVGNVVQRYHEMPKWWSPDEIIKLVWGNKPVCFPCVLLRRDMIRRIGLLDESLEGYGYDDDEYCQRARRMGWDTAVTSKIVVQHGDGGRDLTRGKTWSLSFARKERTNAGMQDYFHRRQMGLSQANSGELPPIYEPRRSNDSQRRLPNRGIRQVDRNPVPGRKP